MELQYTYTIGQAIRVGNSTVQIVLFVSDFTLITAEVSLYDKIAIKLHTYDLTQEDVIEDLNAKTPYKEDGKTYKVPMFSLIEYNYKQYVLLGLTSVKILTFTLDRPLLFDLQEAAKMAKLYFRANELNEFENELTTNYSNYYVVPMADENTIEWEVVEPPIKAKTRITESFLEDAFGQVPYSEISISDFSELFDTKKLNQIEDPALREKLDELIKKTLEYGIQNMSIGYFDDETKKQKYKEWEAQQDDIRAQGLSSIVSGQPAITPEETTPIPSAAVKPIEQKNVHTPEEEPRVEPKEEPKVEPKEQEPAPTPVVDPINIINESQSLDDLLSLLD